MSRHPTDPPLELRSVLTILQLTVVALSALMTAGCSAATAVLPVLAAVR